MNNKDEILARLDKQIHEEGGKLFIDAKALIESQHIKLTQMEGALKLILKAGNNECQSFTSGLGSCYKDSRKEEAEYGADQVCDCCIADKFLTNLTQE